MLIQILICYIYIYIYIYIVYIYIYNDIYLYILYIYIYIYIYIYYIYTYTHTHTYTPHNTHTPHSITKSTDKNTVKSGSISSIDKSSIRKTLTIPIPNHHILLKFNAKLSLYHIIMFWLTDAKWYFKKKLPFYKHKLYIDNYIYWKSFNWL